MKTDQTMRTPQIIAGALLAVALWAAPAGAQQVPPSDAVKLALQAVPGSEPLGVKLKGDHYVVRLKQGGSVIQVLVDAATGAVSQ
ncbi:MAG: PepSY domain-containing protein [Alphaproteobacteria bacterium]|nr:PepSY domain-containing protein [Alphaproteobacteria bacterium]